jgi:peptidoglycan DL-endopeptidase CwlO
VRRNRSRSAAVSLIAVLMASLVAPAATIATPSTPQIVAKQAEAAAANRKLQALSNDLELKREDYLAVTAALQHTRDQILAAQQQLADTQARLDIAQTRLSDRATAMYRGGSVDLLEVLLGTTDFNDFLTRLDILNRISASDADLVSQVTSARDAVAQTQAALQNRETEQIALRSEAAAKQRLVEIATSQQSTYVASLNADIKRLVKAEEDRLAAIAAERARQAAARARTYPSSRSSDVANLGAPHPAAVEEAKKYLGVDYVWGGETPSGFDCSGLVMYCYRQIGIDIPRTSREQFKIGSFIPRDRTDVLAPGDLVFFGTDGDPNQVHHVGMYVGGGTFINAPASGETVRYAQLSDRSDYVGAVRP